MEYKKFGDTFVVRMDRGEEILTQLREMCEKENIRLARVDALGAVDRAEVCVYDVASKTFFKKKFDEPMEISNLCGTVTRREGDVYLHLHVTLCDRELRAHGGHAAELRVAATCEMTVTVIPGEVEREMNEEIGLNVFRFS